MSDLVPQNVRDIVEMTLQGHNLFTVLREKHITPLDFYRYLQKNSEAAELFEHSRQIEIEKLLTEIIPEIDQAECKLDLDKATAKAGVAKWLAEKIIPKTYGQKQEITVNKTIDIRGVLAAIDARVKGNEVIEVQKNTIAIENSNNPIKDISAAELLGE